MTRFAYRAIPTGGVGVAPGGGAGVIEGALEASDESALRARLRDQGLIVVQVRPLSPLDAIRGALRGRRLRRADRSWFFQTLRALLAGKAPIEAALSTMEDLAERPRLKEACANVLEGLRGGSSLDQAIEREPGLADRQASALLRVGHESGRLEQAVMLIDRAIAARERIRKSVVSALIYPAILVVAAIGAVWVLSSFVIPRFAEQLQAAGVELPVSTRLTLAAADWLVWLGPLLAIALALLIATRRTSIPPSVRLWFDRVSLRTPVLGPLLVSAQGASTLETLATMLEGGGDVLSALEQARDASPSNEMRTRLDAVRQSVREGRQVAEALHEHHAIPPMASAIVRAGAAGGDLEGALRRAAEQCATQQEELTARLLALLGPGVILLLAGVIGWVIYSLLAGILTMNDLSGL